MLCHSLFSPLGMKLRAPGLPAHLGLLERIRLSPEGIDHVAYRRLTRSLRCRIFSLTYHRPLLEPGNTPCVGDEAGLRGLRETISRYVD